MSNFTKIFLLPSRHVNFLNFRATNQYQNVAAGRLKKRSVRHTATAATTTAAPPPHHASNAASAWLTQLANGGGSRTPVAFWS